MPAKATVEKNASEDRGAIAELYAQYQPRLFRYLKRRTSDPYLAEELTSRVFYRVVVAFATGELRVDCMSGWLFTIARNELASHFRKSHITREVPLEHEFVGEDRDSMDRRVERLDREEALHAALTRINPRYARVLRLRFHDGLSHAEVSRLVRTTPAGSKVIQHRGIKKLRDLEAAALA